MILAWASPFNRMGNITHYTQTLDMIQYCTNISTDRLTALIWVGYRSLAATDKLITMLSSTLTAGAEFIRVFT